MTLDKQSDKEEVGKKYGKLTITEYLGIIDKRTMVRVLCDCGNSDSRIVSLSDIKRGHTKSCGCLISITKAIHGEAGTRNGGKPSPEYNSWCNMKRRHKNMICERWLDKKNGYLNFLEDMGRRPPSTDTPTADGVKSKLRREFKDMYFCKENCYWFINELSFTHMKKFIKENKELYSLIKKVSKQWDEINIIETEEETTDETET